MRGGAIPVLVWGTLLLVLFIGNWIWDAKAVNAAEAAAAAVIVYAVGVMLWLARRDAIRRGPPAPETEVDAVPQASLAAVLVAIAIASILFGLAWAKFLVYFGLGLLILSLGRLVIEWRAERMSRRAIRHDQGKT